MKKHTRSSLPRVDGVNYHKDHHTFAAQFTDGITIVVDEEMKFKNMLSVGLESSFLKTGKWPTQSNISKRCELIAAWAEKNKKRYKHLNKK